MNKLKGSYKVPLPSPPSVEFTSEPGMELFHEATKTGTMANFFKLIFQFQTQSEPVYCGLASLSMSLNALAIDPRKIWKGRWRWFDETMIDCCDSFQNVKKNGITFGKFAYSAQFSGAKIEPFCASRTSIKDFRKHVINSSSVDGTVYKVPLPSPPSVEFTSEPGMELFHEATKTGTMANFFKLIFQFQTQSEPVYCGLASLSMSLNALAIDPRKIWKGRWRWFDETMIDCCDSFQNVKKNGITFGKFAYSAQFSGAKVEPFYASHTSIEDFRKHVINSSSVEGTVMILSYHRSAVNQSGSGHFSPIGGYHVETDMILILDVARFKYSPHWVPLTNVWQGMNTIDVATGQTRGFFILSRPHEEPGLLYTLNSRHKTWNVAKSLIDDFPLLLKSDDMNDIHKVLSIIVTLLSSNFEDFIINWGQERSRRKLSTEEERGQAVKEEVLKQVQETRLYTHVASFLSNSHACAQGADALTVLLFSLPPSTWSAIKDELLLKEMDLLVSTEDVPILLQEEILNLRRQLRLLKKCQEGKLDEDLGAAFT